MEMTAPKINAKDIAYIGIFAALMAICSWISLPLPSGIPVTLQTFAVFLAAGALGGRRGTITVLVYLLLAATGAPVLAGFNGGIGSFVTPSGGYLTGFLFTALLMWGLERLLGKSTWVLAVSMVLGLLVCYAFGTVWFMAVYAESQGAVGLMTVLGWCVFPYIIPDSVKIFLALLLSVQLRRHVK